MGCEGQTSTHKRHWSQIYEWQHTHGKRTLGSKGELTLSAITNTHLLLWAAVSPDQLPDATRQLLEDKTH